MPRGVRHTKAKHINTCKFCKKEFFGKKPDMQICYEDVCQRKYQTEKLAARYERQKLAKLQANASAEAEAK